MVCRCKPPPQRSLSTQPTAEQLPACCGPLGRQQRHQLTDRCAAEHSFPRGAGSKRTAPSPNMRPSETSLLRGAIDAVRVPPNVWSAFRRAAAHAQGLGVLPHIHAETGLCRQRPQLTVAMPRCVRDLGETICFWLSSPDFLDCFGKR